MLYYAMGYPNDEVLHGHPLYEYGLEHYQFHLISDSPLLNELERRNQIHARHVKGMYSTKFSHWVITFHDETLEIVAASAAVAGVTKDHPAIAVRRLWRPDGRAGSSI